MNQAILTKSGAERHLRPDLAGALVTYERIHVLGTCVENVYTADGKKLSPIMAFKGPDPSVELVTEE